MSSDLYPHIVKINFLIIDITCVIFFIKSLTHVFWFVSNVEISLFVAVI